MIKNIFLSLPFLFFFGCSSANDSSIKIILDEDNSYLYTFDKNVPIEILNFPKYATIDLDKNSFIYRPKLDFNGNDAFKVKQNEEIFNFDVKVLPINDPPVTTKIALNVGALPFAMVNIRNNSNLLTNNIDSTNNKNSIEYFGESILFENIAYENIGDNLGNQELSTVGIGILNSSDSNLKRVAIAFDSEYSFFKIYESPMRTMYIRSNISNVEQPDIQIRYQASLEGVNFRLSFSDDNNISKKFDEQNGVFEGSFSSLNNYSNYAYFNALDDYKNILKLDSNQKGNIKSRRVAFNVKSNQELNANLNGYDIDSVSLTYEVEIYPAFGKLKLDTDGKFSYYPDSGFVGSDKFSYKIFDGLLKSDEQEVILWVE